MFKKLKKIRLPFLPKKLVEIPLEDRIVAAENEAKNYPLILDNSDLSTLIKHKFMTATGTQVQPQEFIAKMIEHIEKNPPQSPEEFAVYVRKTITDIPPTAIIKKKRFLRRG